VNRKEEINLHLQSLDQLIERRAPSLFIESRFWHDAKKFIVDEVQILKRYVLPA
jgi:hypothetical protein